MPRRLAALALCLALFAGRAFADEWDIFDAAEAPRGETDTTLGSDIEGSDLGGSGDVELGDAGLGEDFPGLFTEAPRHRVSTSLSGRFLASTLADPSEPVLSGGLSGEAFDFEFLYGFEARLGGGSLSFFTELAFAANDSGAVDIPGQDAYPDLAFARLVVERLDLRYVAAETLHVDLGILPLRFGNGLYFNPVDFLARGVDNPESSGATSYPAIQVSLLGRLLSASISYIPYQAEALDALALAIPGAFQQGYDGHVVAARGGGFFLGANLSALGFLKTGGLDGNQYALGMELQSPLSRYANVCLQALLSNGMSAYEASPTPTPTAYYLGQRASSRDEALLDAYIELDLPLGSALMLRAAYRYNQRGLSLADFRVVSDSLALSGHPDIALMRDSAFGLSYSPLPFLRHTAVAGLVFPELARSLSASVLAMSGLVDTSLGVYASLDYAAGDATTISLSGACAIGPEGSAFGLSRDKVSVTLSLELYL